MLRVIVDSCSSIKQTEKEKYNVDIVPLRYMLGDKEYLDDVDITIDEFYKELISKKLFPKTSLPNLEDVKELVEKYNKNGDDVLILTLSSKLSGTFSAINQMFEGNSKVKVIDSLSCVGGMRIIVEEINRHRDESLDELEKRINNLIPKIRILAIPETLNYLLKGGRLSRKEWLLGTILNIKPVITVIDGGVKVKDKKIGLVKAMQYLANSLTKLNCDEKYPIVPVYTHNRDNLEKLIAMTDDKYKLQMTDYDNVDPVVACHWGPNAFGYVFVSKDKMCV